MAPVWVRRHAVPSKFHPQLELLEERNLLTTNLTGQEQLLLELINRGRANPTAEAARLGIALNEGLAAGTISTAAKQPLAPNQALINAMRNHLSYLLGAGLPDVLSHTGPAPGFSTPATRVAAAGYSGATSVGENLAASWSSGGINLTAETIGMYNGLFTDEDVPGRGHRINLMNGTFKEVGPGVISGSYNWPGAGPGTAAFSGQDFGTRPGNSFLTGVFYTDGVVNDNFYTVNEGMGGITVRATPTGGGTSFTDVTGNAGGYAFQLGAGTYNVTASGPGIAGTVNLGQITIAASNVKVDFAADNPPPPPPPPPPALPDQTVGIFDPNSATWYLRNSNSSGGPSVTPFAYGFGGTIPVVGDWNGDGIDSIGLYHPATATWYLRNSNSAGGTSIAPFAYGFGGAIPVVGDWDGNGTDTIGLYDPNTAMWYLRNSNGPGAPSITPFAYGFAGTIPVVGDWDGNGTDTIGLYHPATATWYLRNSNAPGAPSVTPFTYGFGSHPVVGDWDGDGDTTIGIYNPGNATWYVRNSNGAGGPSITPFAYGFGTRPLVGNWDLALPLLAESAKTGTTALLSQDAAADILAAARQRLALAGADAAILDRLQDVQLFVGDFSGLALGFAQPHRLRIVLDADAAGHGWFVDPTPLDNAEFADGIARAGSAAAGRMDLLTVVLHELGHIAGLEHAADGLMAEALAAGVRHEELGA